jgi:hypothetical protein
MDTENVTNSLAQSGFAYLPEVLDVEAVMQLRRDITALLAADGWIDPAHPLDAVPIKSPSGPVDPALLFYLYGPISRGLNRSTVYPLRAHFLASFVGFLAGTCFFTRARSLASTGRESLLQQRATKTFLSYRGPRMH